MAEDAHVAESTEEEEKRVWGWENVSRGRPVSSSPLMSVAASAASAASPACRSSSHPRQGAGGCAARDKTKRKNRGVREEATETCRLADGTARNKKEAPILPTSV